VAGLYEEFDDFCFQGEPAVIGGDSNFHFGSTLTGNKRRGQMYTKTTNRQSAVSILPSFHC
jgi:hypothetical protein